jgi:hypothetical protein
MDDKKQVKLLEDAIALYKDGAILEAGYKACEFINTIADFLIEERSKRRMKRWKRSASLNRQ